MLTSGRNGLKMSVATTKARPPAPIPTCGDGIAGTRAATGEIFAHSLRRSAFLCRFLDAGRIHSVCDSHRAGPLDSPSRSPPGAAHAAGAGAGDRSPGTRQLPAEEQGARSAAAHRPARARATRQADRAGGVRQRRPVVHGLRHRGDHPGPRAGRRVRSPSPCPADHARHGRACW